MFGSVSEWFYRWLGGIQPDPDNPGFREFTLAPSTPKGLDFVNCSYYSPFGEIVSNWQRDESGNIRFEMTIPAGSEANVVLTKEPAQKISIERTDGHLDREIDNLQTTHFRLNEGKYAITIDDE